MEPISPRPLTLSPRLLGLFLILAAVIAYLPAINAGFIWDDDLLLTQNYQLQTAHGLTQIWLGQGCNDYTPLTFTTFWLEKRVWGDTATGYHVTNILLHAVAALLLWRILSILRIPGGWLAALLFVIHPVNVASVAWIAERKNTLSAVFYFGSVLGFLAAHKQSARKWLCLSLFLFLLAGLSKGAVVTLPLVLIGCVLWMDRTITRGTLCRLAPFFAIALIISWLTIRYQSAATNYQLAGFDPATRLARAGLLPWLYLRELFFPVGLSPMSSVLQPDLGSPLVYLSPILILSGLGLFLWKSGSWGKPFFFASSYYLWTLLPVLGVVWMTFQQAASYADWWQYLAAPGIFALIAGGIAGVNCLSSRTLRLSSHIIIGILLALLLGQTWRRCATYQSMESYCHAVLSENPHIWGLQNNLGLILQKRGEGDRAMACYRSALADNPRLTQAHNNLGNLLAKQGNFRQAEQEFKTALALQPHNPGILENLADVYFVEGRIPETFATHAEAIELDRENPNSYVKFGRKLKANNQFEQAIVCFRNALVLSPEDPKIEMELAQTLIAAGRNQDAARICDQALQHGQRSGNRAVMQAFAILRSRCEPSVHR